jgi:hypothetical protein
MNTPTPEQLDLDTALDQENGLDEWMRELPCPPWTEHDDPTTQRSFKSTPPDSRAVTKSDPDSAGKNDV